MITLAYLWFVRNVWRDGRFAATVNFAIIAMILDIWIAAEVLT